MKVNPLNVINLLLATFQTLNIKETPTNVKEIELKEHFEAILLDAMEEFNGVEMIIEESLDFQEPFKNLDAQIIEDDVQHHIPDSPFSPTDRCTQDEEELSYDYKLRAVEYWRSGKKKNLSLQSVQQKFRKTIKTLGPYSP